MLRPKGVYITLGAPLSTLLPAGLSTVLTAKVGDRWMGLLVCWKPSARRTWRP